MFQSPNCSRCTWLMNRKFLRLGLCIFLIGLVCLITGSFFIKKTDYTQIAYAEERWNLEAKLTAGRKYWLYVEAADDWGDPFREGFAVDPQPVYINVTLPNGGFAIIIASFYGLSQSSAYYKVNLAIVNVKYGPTTDPDYLDIDEGASQILFTVKRTGNYIFNIVRTGIARETPPTYIALREEVIVNAELYYVSVLSGGLTCIISVPLLTLGVLKKTSTRYRKEKLKLRRCCSH